MVGDLTTLVVGPAWRFLPHSFNLNGLEPGEYGADLMVDEMPAGTYGFTLR